MGGRLGGGAVVMKYEGAAYFLLSYPAGTFFLDVLCLACTASTTISSASCVSNLHCFLGPFPLLALFPSFVSTYRCP